MVVQFSGRYLLEKELVEKLGDGYRVKEYYCMNSYCHKSRIYRKEKIWFFSFWEAIAESAIGNNSTYEVLSPLTARELEVIGSVVNIIID